MQRHGFESPPWQNHFYLFFDIFVFFCLVLVSAMGSKYTAQRLIGAAAKGRLVYVRAQRALRVLYFLLRLRLSVSISLGAREARPQGLY